MVGRQQAPPAGAAADRLHPLDQGDERLREVRRGSDQEADGEPHAPRSPRPIASPSRAASRRPSARPTSRSTRTSRRRSVDTGITTTSPSRPPTAPLRADPSADTTKATPSGRTPTRTTATATTTTTTTTARTTTGTPIRTTTSGADTTGSIRGKPPGPGIASTRPTIAARTPNPPIEPQSTHPANGKIDPDASSFPPLVVSDAAAEIDEVEFPNLNEEAPRSIAGPLLFHGSRTWRRSLTRRCPRPRDRASRAGVVPSGRCTSNRA